LKNDKNLTMIVILLIARNDANKLRRGRENILRNIVSMMRLIEKRDAMNCGKQCLAHGHHPDYSKPLNVVWLCRECHKAVHRKVTQ